MTRIAHLSWLLALAVLLAGCPGSLPVMGDNGGSSTGDMAIGSLGGPCFSDNTCYAGYTCSNGVCIQSSSQEGGNPQADSGDGPHTETSTPQPDLTPPTPDLPPTPDQKITANGTFGSICSATAYCSASYSCVVIGAGASKGFCTKTCPTMTQQCTGGPSGTQPYCILKNSSTSKYYCVFLCKWGTGSSTSTAACPKDLTCDTSQNPPGSGQYVCIP